MIDIGKSNPRPLNLIVKLFGAYMSESKQSHSIEVAGAKLNLRSAHSGELVDNIAALFNEKINEVKQVNSQISYQNSLILAGLQLAEEYLLFKKASLQKINHIETEAQGILKEFEDSPMSKIQIEV